MSTLKWKALFARIILGRLLNDRSIGISRLYPVLQRYPYWLEGQLYVAEQNLALKDVARAYAAAQVIVGSDIPLNSRYRQRAGFLIARCHLAKGDVTTALEMFERWKETYSETSSVQEEIAACLIALNRLDEAHTILAAIEPQKMSQEARAALLFLTNKQSQASVASD